MRGRKPIPTELAIRLGKITRSEADASPEPQPEKGPLECPDFLGPEAKAAWDWLVPLMEAAGVLTKADLGQVVAYCVAYGELAYAESELRRLGRIVTSQKGAPILNPMVSIQRHSIEQIDKIGSSLGLNPTARARMRGATSKKQKEKNGLGKFTKPRLVS